MGSLDSHLLLSTDAAQLPGRWEKSLSVLQQNKGPISWEKIQASGVYLYKDTDVSSCEEAYLVAWLTLPNILKGRIKKKGISTDVTCFARSGLRSVFTFNTSRKKRRGGHTGIHKHETPLRVEEMKGETRLLCHWVCWAQIILSICLCWTCIPLLHPQSPQ